MASNNGLTIPLARKLFSCQRLTPSQVALYCHNLAEFTQSQFNVFSCLFPLEETLAAAAEAEKRYRDGCPKSVLDGIPVSIKCNIAVKGKPLNASSHALNNTMGYESVVAKKLRENGAILIGSTNMDEFGMGSLGNNCNTPTGSNTPGVTTNPVPYMMMNNLAYSKRSTEELIHDIKSLTLPEFVINQNHLHVSDQFRSPGGSSSGSAVSVALGSSLASIGTDTGGSIRLPAAWCGVIGLKPTYGAISRQGVISYASSLDTVGIIANSVRCASLILDVLKNDERESLEQLGDSTSCFIGPVSTWMDNDIFTDGESSCKSTSPYISDLSSLRIGIPEAFVVKECHPQILKAWDHVIKRLEAKNATIHIISDKKISSSAVKMALPAYYVISSAEASSNLARYDGLKYGMSNVDPDKETVHNSLDWREEKVASIRVNYFGNEVKRRILAGTAVLSSDRFHSFYEGATKVRATIVSQFKEAFRKRPEDDGVDFILIPTTVNNPPSLDKDNSILDNTEAFQNDIMTTPISLAGLPSISLPIWDKEFCTSIDSQLEHSVVGMQIIGPKKSEERLLHVSSIIS